MHKDRLEEIKKYLDEIYAIGVKYNTINKTTYTFEIAVELVEEVERLKEILAKIHYCDE